MKKVVVIGAGPGGYHAAVLLAKSGCKVTLVDKRFVGGTCLNIGCIPTKALLDHISLFEYFKESTVRKKIFSAENLGINIDNLRAFQLEAIDQLKFGLEKLFKNKGVDFLCGTASLLSEKKVLIVSEDSKVELEADEIIIATGSKPRSIPTFTLDSKLISSSDDVWNIPLVPQKLLIIGSGPIGIEFARIFNALGSKVTVSEIKELLCPILDLEVSEHLGRSLKKRGITLKINTASKLIEKKDSSVKVEFISAVDGAREQNEYDQVLIAVGREPNTESLRLENAGVELGGGFIKVSEYLQTTKKNIWAIGDVTNYPQLAHTASSQAKVVCANILGKQETYSGELIPSCIFGYPEVAFIGQTEETLKEKKASYKSGKFLFLASGKAKASGLTEGLVKVLMDTNTKKVLGAHIIGPEASNLIHELVVGMQNNLTVDKIAKSIHIHPTYSEVVLEALEDCLGIAVHV